MAVNTQTPDRTTDRLSVLTNMTDTLTTLYTNNNWDYHQQQQSRDQGYESAPVTPSSASTPPCSRASNASTPSCSRASNSSTPPYSQVSSASATHYTEQEEDASDDPSETQNAPLDLRTTQNDAPSSDEQTNDQTDPGTENLSQENCPIDLSQKDAPKQPPSPRGDAAKKDKQLLDSMRVKIATLFSKTDGSTSNDSGFIQVPVTNEYNSSHVYSDSSKSKTIYIVCNESPLPVSETGNEAVKNAAKFLHQTMPQEKDALYLSKIPNDYIASETASRRFESPRASQHIPLDTQKLLSSSLIPNTRRGPDPNRFDRGLDLPNALPPQIRDYNSLSHGLPTSTELKCSQNNTTRYRRHQTSQITLNQTKSPRTDTCPSGASARMHVESSHDMFSSLRQFNEPTAMTQWSRYFSDPPSSRQVNELAKIPQNSRYCPEPPSSRQVNEPAKLSQSSRYCLEPASSRHVNEPVTMTRSSRYYLESPLSRQVNELATMTKSSRYCPEPSSLCQANDLATVPPCSKFCPSQTIWLPSESSEQLVRTRPPSQNADHTVYHGKEVTRSSNLPFTQGSITSNRMSSNHNLRAPSLERDTHTFYCPPQQTEAHSGVTSVRNAHKNINVVEDFESRKQYYEILDHANGYVTQRQSSVGQSQHNMGQVEAVSHIRSDNVPNNNMHDESDAFIQVRSSTGPSGQILRHIAAINQMKPIDQNFRQINGPLHLEQIEVLKQMRSGNDPIHPSLAQMEALRQSIHSNDPIHPSLRPSEAISEARPDSGPPHQKLAQIGAIKWLTSGNDPIHPSPRLSEAIDETWPGSCPPHQKLMQIDAMRQMRYGNDPMHQNLRQSEAMYEKGPGNSPPHQTREQVDAMRQMRSNHDEMDVISQIRSGNGPYNHVPREVYLKAIDQIRATNDTSLGNFAPNETISDHQVSSHNVAKRRRIATSLAHPTSNPSGRQDQYTSSSIFQAPVISRENITNHSDMTSVESHRYQADLEVRVIPERNETYHAYDCVKRTNSDTFGTDEMVGKVYTGICDPTDACKAQAHYANSNRKHNPKRRRVSTKAPKDESNKTIAPNKDDTNKPNAKQNAPNDDPCKHKVMTNTPKSDPSEYYKTNGEKVSEETSTRKQNFRNWCCALALSHGKNGQTDGECSKHVESDDSILKTLLTERSKVKNDKGSDEITILDPNEAQCSENEASSSITSGLSKANCPILCELFNYARTSDEAGSPLVEGSTNLVDKSCESPPKKQRTTHHLQTNHSYSNGLKSGDRVENESIIVSENKPQVTNKYSDLNLSQITDILLNVPSRKKFSKAYSTVSESSNITVTDGKAGHEEVVDKCVTASTERTQQIKLSKTRVIAISRGDPQNTIPNKHDK